MSNFVKVPCKLFLSFGPGVVWGANARGSYVGVATRGLQNYTIRELRCNDLWYASQRRGSKSRRYLEALKLRLGLKGIANLSFLFGASR